MFIFYSLAGKLIKQQQSKVILNATNDFVFALQNQLLVIDEDFRNITPHLNNFDKLTLDSTSIDFVFTLVNDSLINNREFKVKTNSELNIHHLSFKKFFVDNPNLILKYSQLSNGNIVYYGSLISSRFLDRISEKIRAEIAVLIDNSPYEVSNSDKNQTNLLSVIAASHYLKFKNSYDIFSEELENVDFVAVLYSPKYILTPGAKIDFVVFNAFREGVEFRETLRIVMLLIILAGSAITFIMVILFTAKLRKQISLLSLAAEITGKGGLEHRVPIITNDEVGHFGVAFNRMLDELARNKKAEHEYSEFITLINQNPTLKEISDAALTKIIKSTSLTFGVLYIVEQKSLRLISSYGISRNLVTPLQSADLYSNAIEKKERLEFHFHDNFPEIKTGIASVKIKYLMIFPVVYNKETIAVLEIASESTPQTDVLHYIDNIHEQLAIGLVNAKSFEQLENLVNELRDLNEEYQKQNKQIIEQNSQLKELHIQLKEKAGELERQRSNAVELSKVKSDFLAGMSHELRTPLISILGLT
jgi:signal transduction histidine kinase